MEEISLEKIDIIRQRTGVGYAQAKELLEKNNGNVVDALIYFEQNQKNFAQNIANVSNDLIETVKDIIKKGNVSRIKIKKDNRVLIDIPVNAGIAAGALGLFYPALIAVGAVAALATKIVIEIERPDGKIDIVNDVIKEKYDDVKEKFEDVKNKAEDAVNNIKEDIGVKLENMNNDENDKDNVDKTE
ncbi:DUF4342 domain-containing protein [Caloramator sp. E03]|uniref:DUF4342 domain-containing protein n=1 Tax=Caloramator sp. E03 TaxID=2576307 RepID=UPI00111023B0|nr:DUF4342 domain-containing protein [Caloramator sp. E03]QCX32399.1 DUF4342 domain-containing protein [Caloramator sp. E03]